MKRIIFVIFLVGSLWGFGQESTSQNAKYFSKGIECKYKDDVQGAIKNYEQALKYMPNDAASMYELSEQYVKAGRMDDAFSMISKAAELDPSNKWYQMRLGRFYRNMEQYDEFIRLYDKLTEQYPEDIDMLGELIDVLLMNDQYDLALKKLDVLEKQVGMSSLVSEQRVEIYKRQGNTKKVISELQKLISEEPENTRYYNMLAAVYMENGKEKEAIALYEKVKELDPNDPYINIALLEYYEKKGDLDQAFNELIGAINNKNLDFNTKANIYDYWFNKFQTSDKIDQQAFQAGKAFVENYPDNKMGYQILGSYYLNKEEYRPCRDMAQKALQADPTSFAAWQQLVVCDASLRENDSLKTHSLQALQFYTTQPVFYWFAGVSHAYDKQDEEAIKYFEKGRKFVTDKKLLCDFDSYLGDLYHSVGEEEKSFQAYERVLQTEPDDVLVLNNYAYYLALRSDHLDKAKEMSLRAVELAPNNPTYLDTYAWVLYKLKDYEGAEAQMKKALNLLDSPDGTYFEHYGDILFQLGRKQEAVEYWDKAKKAGGGSKLLDKKLKDKTLYE